MPTTSFFSRRGALATLIALLLAGLWGAAIKGERPAATFRARQMGLLSLLRRQKASAKQIGLAFLTQMPQERDAQTLVDGILAGTPDIERGLRRADSLRSRVKRLISEDFAEARTVSLDGWILSLTEARLCALHVLEHSAID